MKIEGKFLKLRLLVEADAEVTLKWRLSERSNLLNKGATTLAEQQNWIKSRPISEYNFIIELTDSTPIGMLSLINVNMANKNAEPARFLIGEEKLARGLPASAEAMLLLYRFAFEELKLERVYGLVLEENKAMLKWQLFYGMKEEGTMRRHYFINNKFQDAIMVGLLKEEYLRTAKPRLETMTKISGVR